MAKKKRKADDEKPKKKNARAADLDDEDDEPADDFEDDGDDFAEPRKPSRNDAYTGMLVIALLCLVAASVLLMLDGADMTASPLSNPTVNVPALAAPPAAPAL